MSMFISKGPYGPKCNINLNKNVGAEADLEEVISDEKFPNVDRLSIFHVVGAPDLDDVHVRQADQYRGKRTRHQEPPVSPNKNNLNINYCKSYL